MTLRPLHHIGSLRATLTQSLSYSVKSHDWFIILCCSVSSLAWFMSNQETSFVTIGQRILANPLRLVPTCSSLIYFKCDLEYSSYYRIQILGVFNLTVSFSVLLLHFLLCLFYLVSLILRGLTVSSICLTFSTYDFLLDPFLSCGLSFCC